MFPGLSAPVPAELGTTDDPRALIPGSPDAILAKLATLTKLSTGIDEASTAFTKIDEGRWQGAAGDAFRQAFSQEVPRWANSAQAFDQATKALQEHAHTLQAAQNHASEAIARFNQGTQATKTAQAQYNAAVQQRNAQAAQGETVSAMAPFSDPGTADRQEAHAILEDARRMVQQSGDNAARAIGAARDSAPQGPGPLERVWAGLTETAGSVVNANWHLLTGEVDAAVDLVKPLATLNPIAAFTHPMAYTSNVANMATGLLHAVNHPVQVAKSMVDWGDWSKDPAAALGKTAVNIGSIFVGGEGAAAKGAEIGAQGAKVAGIAGDAEKAAEAANLGKTVEETSHPPLKPADWADPIPDDGTPFGPQGSQSIDHAPLPPTGSRTDGGFGPLGSDHPTLHGDLHDPAPADHTPPPDHASAGHPALHGDLHDPALADHTPPPDHQPHADHQPLDQPLHHDAPQHAQEPPSQKYAGNSDFHASEADHQAFRNHLGEGAFHPRIMDELRGNLHDFHPDIGHMPDEELVGMKRYTSIHHMDINQALREGDPTALHNLDPEIKNAASGMNKLPDWQGTTERPLVYRGIDVDPDHLPDVLSRYGDNEMVTEPGFTSGDKENPYPGNVQFVIEPRYGKDLEFLNPYGGMREVCWPPGNRFEVIRKYFDDTKGQWQIHLRDHGR